jgi:hypothetical protein
MTIETTNPRKLLEEIETAVYTALCAGATEDDVLDHYEMGLSEYLEAQHEKEREA